MAEANERIVSQRPNPELDVQSAFGSNRGQPASQIQVIPYFSLELGGKRDARLKKASAETDVKRASYGKTLDEVRIRVLENLFSLKFRIKEEKLFSEAFSIIKRIEKQYRVKPRLSPDQEASLYAFELSEAQYTVLLNRNDQDKKILLNELRIATGLDDSTILRAINSDSTASFRWPTISELDRISKHEKSADARLVDTELKLSLSELELARSYRWPTLRFGPQYQWNVDGENKYESYGLAFAVPIPIFHTGRAEVVASETGYSLFLLQKSIVLNRISEELKLELEGYQKSKQLFEEIQKKNEKIRSKHKRLEQLFLRGLVTATLVFEVHRQRIDFERSKFETEMSGVVSLARYLALQGAKVEDWL